MTNRNRCNNLEPSHKQPRHVMLSSSIHCLVPLVVSSSRKSWMVMHTGYLSTAWLLSECGLEKGFLIGMSEKWLLPWDLDFLPADHHQNHNSQRSWNWSSKPRLLTFHPYDPSIHLSSHRRAYVPPFPFFHSAGNCWGTTPCAKNYTGSTVVYKAHSSCFY